MKFLSILAITSVVFAFSACQTQDSAPADGNDESNVTATINVPTPPSAMVSATISVPTEE